MSVRPDDGAAGSFSKWLSGPQLEADVEPTQMATQEQPYESELERYDEDFDYYWGDWKIPLWIALIMQVPWRQRLDIFVIGFIVGLVIAGIAMSWGLLLSRY